MMIIRSAYLYSKVRLKLSLSKVLLVNDFLFNDYPNFLTFLFNIIFCKFYLIAHQCDLNVTVTLRF